MNTQKPLLGASLALLASIMWGILPLAAQQSLKIIDAQTLVWSRFLTAALFLFLLALLRKKLPNLKHLSKKHWALFIIAIVALSLNFVFFAQSLHYVSAVTPQVLWQLAPFGMIISGIFVFGEKMGRFQILGLILLILGLIAFFNQRFDEILQFGHYAIGIMFACASALIWVFYGIAQKLLSRDHASSKSLLLIYFGCALCLSPSATFTQLIDLEGFYLLCFLFCCANTLIAYGAYGEALNHWDTSKISIITSLSPIFSMSASHLAHVLSPTRFAPLNMNTLSYMGACLVIVGAIIAIVGEQWFRTGKKMTARTTAR